MAGQFPFLVLSHDHSDLFPLQSKQSEHLTEAAADPETMMTNLEGTKRKLTSQVTRAEKKAKAPGVRKWALIEELNEWRRTNAAKDMGLEELRHVKEVEDKMLLLQQL